VTGQLFLACESFPTHYAHERTFTGVDERVAREVFLAREAFATHHAHERPLAGVNK